jgi:hypothetical protein
MCSMQKVQRSYFLCWIMQDVSDLYSDELGPRTDLKADSYTEKSIR